MNLRQNLLQGHQRDGSCLTLWCPKGQLKMIMMPMSRSRLYVVNTCVHSPAASPRRLLRTPLKTRNSHILSWTLNFVQRTLKPPNRQGSSGPSTLFSRKDVIIPIPIQERMKICLSDATPLAKEMWQITRQQLNLAVKGALSRFTSPDHYSL